MDSYNKNLDSFNSGEKKYSDDESSQSEEYFDGPGNESDNQTEFYYNGSGQKDYMEVDLKDMIRVFMEQNAQFEFLNKFYENTESENTETETSESENLGNVCNSGQCSMELVNEYYIFIWKYITNTENADKINVFSIAKDRETAIQQIKNRYYITKQQKKNNKKTFCVLDGYLENNFTNFMHQITTQKCVVFPCKNFSCFF